MKILRKPVFTGKKTDAEAVNRYNSEVKIFIESNKLSAFDPRPMEFDLRYTLMEEQYGELAMSMYNYYKDLGYFKNDCNDVANLINTQTKESLPKDFIEKYAKMNGHYEAAQFEHRLNNEVQELKEEDPDISRIASLVNSGTKQIVEAVRKYPNLSQQQRINAMQLDSDLEKW